MIGRLKPRSEFGRNVATLMTGTTVAQALPVAISPILTRLYSPEDFGVLALFVAITTIFGSIANARYELAIMLPHEDEEALNIAALGLLTAFALSIVLLLLVLVFNAEICGLLGNERIGPWLYLIPLSVFFTGLFNVLNYYNNRIKQYGDIARANVLKAIVMASVQLAAGGLKLGGGGLVLGHAASSLFANAKLLRNVRARVDFKGVVHWASMSRLGRRYLDFPKYSMPSVLANSLSLQVASILIPAYYSVSTLGFYSVVQRVLGMPMALIGSAVSQVFFQTAVADRNRKGNALEVFDRTLFKLMSVSIPGGIFFYFIAPWAFGIVFGAKWEVAGEYARILVPLYALRFVSSALSVVLTVFERQRQSLLINLALVCQVLACLYMVRANSGEFETFLVSLSISGSVLYVAFIFYYRAVSRGGES